MWPKTLALISAWGTANMRTGGDDLAQVLALMGVQPTWDTASRRVDRLRDPAAVGAGPAARGRHAARLRLLPRRLPAPDRPDRLAGRAVAELDEPADQNPLAAR